MLTFVAGRACSRALTVTSRSRFCGQKRSGSAAPSEFQQQDFDWLKIAEKDVHEMPDINVDEEALKKGDAWWKNLMFDDVFADEKEISETLDRMEASTEPSTCEKLMQYPLPDSPYPADMDPIAIQQRLHRYEELLQACIKASRVCFLL